MKENIVPKNSKGELHGYQEWYFNIHGKIRHRGYRITELYKGYVEWHSCIIRATEFHIR
jgi:hypothetical protein